MVDWVRKTLLAQTFYDRYQELSQHDSLFCAGGVFGDPIRYRLHAINIEPAEPVRWRQCLLVVDGTGIHIHRKTRDMDEQFTVQPGQLRWFGRPEKYQPGNNDIWLHLEQGQRWHRLELRLWQSRMQELVRALKMIATEAQVTAYRRRRPYIHFGPVRAHTATQDLHGAWTLTPEPVSLYLLPSALVILNAGHVQRVLPLESVQQIEVMRRLDDATGTGVVRFQFNGDTLAYALPDYIQFGADLAEAAKRTLEAPPVFYGKKKDDNLDADWEE